MLKHLQGLFTTCTFSAHYNMKQNFVFKIKSYFRSSSFVSVLMLTLYGQNNGAMRNFAISCFLLTWISVVRLQAELLMKGVQCWVMKLDIAFVLMTARIPRLQELRWNSVWSDGKVSWNSYSTFAKSVGKLWCPVWRVDSFLVFQMDTLGVYWGGCGYLELGCFTVLFWQPLL